MPIGAPLCQDIWAFGQLHTIHGGCLSNSVLRRNRIGTFCGELPSCILRFFGPVFCFLAALISSPHPKPRTANRHKAAGGRAAILPLQPTQTQSPLSGRQITRPRLQPMVLRQESPRNRSRNRQAKSTVSWIINKQGLWGKGANSKRFIIRENV